MSSLSSWIRTGKDGSLEHISLLLHQLIDKHDKIIIYQSKRLLASCMRKGSPYMRGVAFVKLPLRLFLLTTPYLLDIPEKLTCLPRGGVPPGEPGYDLLGGRHQLRRLHPAWRTPNPPVYLRHLFTRQHTACHYYSSPPPPPTPANTA